MINDEKRQSNMHTLKLQTSTTLKVRLIVHTIGMSFCNDLSAHELLGICSLIAIGQLLQRLALPAISNEECETPG